MLFKWLIKDVKKKTLRNTWDKNIKPTTFFFQMHVEQENDEGGPWTIQ